MNEERIMLVEALHATERKMEMAERWWIKTGRVGEELRQQWERYKRRLADARQALADYDAAHKGDAR